MAFIFSLFHLINISNIFANKLDSSLYVDVPNMSLNVVIFPGSLKLLFDLKISGTSKHTIVNNIGKVSCRI